MIHHRAPRPLAAFEGAASLCVTVKGHSGHTLGREQMGTDARAVESFRQEMSAEISPHVGVIC